MTLDPAVFEGWSQEDLDAFRSVDWEAMNGFEPWKTVVAERFPAYQHMLDHPELGPLLEEAAEGEFELSTFEARFRATEWFTSRSAAEREWDLFADDPANEAERDRQIAERAGTVRDLSAQLGAELSDDAITALATEALRRGLSEDEVVGQITASTTSYSAGSLTAAEDQIAALAAGQLIDVDAETRRSLAVRLVNGEMNEDGLRSYVTNIAKSQHPQFSKFIDQGISVAEYLAPQRNTIASMLGRNPADIDLMSPEFSAVTRMGDGSDLRAMTLDETTRFVRSRDDYWQGSQGQEELFGMVNGLSRALGVRR